jgi:hypothetical protein
MRFKALPKVGKIAQTISITFGPHGSRSNTGRTKGPWDIYGLSIR